MPRPSMALSTARRHASAPAARAVSSPVVATTPRSPNSRTASWAISRRVAALRRPVSGGRPAGAAIVFLASDAASDASGVILPVDNG
jgi:enoyl-[acyl-carrier-protein] reductase (NADH)